MKKIFILIIVGLFIITGCGSENKGNNVEKEMKSNLIEKLE